MTTISLESPCHSPMDRPGSATRLPEFCLYEPQPGHPDWAALAEEARRLADELRPHLERPQRGVRELRRRAASYRTAAGNFARNWRITRRGREDLLPLYFIWTTTRVCNFLCTYCDDHRGRRYPELSNEGVLSTAQGKRLLEVMRTRTPSVYFAGGEPTVRNDLPALTRHARELSYYPIVVNTNGSLLDRQLRRPAWRGFLADVDLLVVSLDALDPAALSKMWGTKRPLRVLRNLLALRELAGELGVKLMVNTVIQPDTVDEAGQVLDFANDLDIWFCPVPMNVGAVVSDALNGDAGYRELVERILVRKRAGYRITGSLRMNERLLGGEPLYCRSSLKPHIDFDGRLFWPCKASVNVEPTLIDVLAFDHVDALWAHATSLVDPTGFHGPADDQCGGNCGWAQNYTTDTYTHGLRHPLSLVKDVLEFVRP